jgi:hypothetical protein
MIKPYWDSRKELHPINLKKKELWKLSIDWFPEYRMTKGNAYEETPLPDLPKTLLDLSQNLSYNLQNCRTGF